MRTDTNYAGQAIDGTNDDGCPYVGQTYENALSAESLQIIADSAGISVEALLQSLQN